MCEKKCLARTEFIPGHAVPGWRDLGFWLLGFAFGIRPLPRKAISLSEFLIETCLIPFQSQLTPRIKADRCPCASKACLKQTKVLTDGDARVGQHPE